MRRWPAMLLACLLAGNSAAVGTELPAAEAAQLLSVILDALQRLAGGGSSGMPGVPMPPDPFSAPLGGSLPSPWDFGGTSPPASDPTDTLQKALANLSADLSGLWMSAGGELFLVQGNRFALHSRSSGMNVEGTFQASGDKLRTQLPGSGQPQEYSYVRRGDTLVFIDSLEQVLVFRRIANAP